MKKQEEKIIHEINGKKYVLINYFIYSKEGVENMRYAAKRFDCILQGITWKYNLFRQYRNAHLLVPEDRIIEFNKEMLSE